MKREKYYFAPEIIISFFDKKDIITESGEAGSFGDEMFTPDDEYGNFWW